MELQPLHTVFVAYPVNYSDDPRVMTHAGKCISYKQTTSGIKSLLFAHHPIDRTADAISACLFSSNLETEKEDSTAFDFTATNDQLKNLIAEYPIVVPEARCENPKFMGGMYTPDYNSNPKTLPRFYFNSKFASKNEAEEFAVKNLKAYNIKNHFLKFLGEMGFWDGDKAPKACEQEKENKLNAKNLLEKTNSSKSGETFVIVANSTAFAFRKNWDHLIDYVDGRWQEVEAPNYTL